MIVPPLAFDGRTTEVTPWLNASDDDEDPPPELPLLVLLHAAAVRAAMAPTEASMAIVRLLIG